MRRFVGLVGSLCVVAPAIVMTMWTPAAAVATTDASSMYFNNQGKSWGDYATMQRAGTTASSDFAVTTNRAFTLEATIKPRSTIADNELAVLDIRNGSGDADSATRFVVKTSDGGVTGRAVIWSMSTGEPATSGTGVTFGQWNHIAAVYDGVGTVKLYVNGVQQTSASWQPGPRTNPALYIGDDTHRFFDGWMNDVRVWNGVARTQAQIAANMNTEIDPATPGLVAYYRFDDGTGTTITDLTGRGHDATTSNSPTWVNTSTSLDNHVAQSCAPTQSTVSGETVQTFSTTGSCTWAVPTGVSSVRALVIGGGGGGGADNGGGGGAGGYVTDTSFAVTAGTDVTVEVGSGGLGGPGSYYTGLTGGRSVFSTLVARGGGGGGSIDNTAGLDGGSAGGRAANRGGSAQAATATGSPAQGNDGGAKNNGGFGGGGGGGAGAAGSNGGSNIGGNGGVGRQNDITGTNSYYAGGGGGGGDNNTAGTGGNGGGGAGSTIGNVAPTAGTDGRGGGGGGAGGNVAGGIGASGGSGIVIIRYTVVVPTTTTSTTTTTTTTVSPTTTPPASTTTPAVVPTTTASSTTTVAVSPATVSVTATTLAAGTGTGTVAAPASTPTSSVAKGTTSTTVTAAPTVTPTTTTAAPTTTTTLAKVPGAPAARPGSAAVRVGGKDITATISRSENRLIVSAGTITATLSIVDSSGTRRALDADGNARILSGDSIQYEIAGLTPGADADVWLFSTPVKMDSVVADTQGVASGTALLPSTVRAGEHRVVVQTTDSNNEASVISVGIAVGKMSTGGSSTRTIALIVLVMAVGAALVLPTVARRRRRTA